MTWCGIEEPIIPNERMYAVDDASGDVSGLLGLATFHVSGLNRYSFTKLERGVRGQIIEELLDVRSCVWTIVASHSHCGQLRIRDLAGAASLRKQDFALDPQGGILIATRPYESCAGDALKPRDLQIPHPAWARSVVLFEGESVGSTVATQSGSSTLRSMASLCPCVAPSHSFLQWVMDCDLSMVYESKDLRDQAGLIIVSPRRLDVSRLLDRALVTRVEKGLAAEAVWAG